MSMVADMVSVAASRKCTLWAVFAVTIRFGPPGRLLRSFIWASHFPRWTVAEHPAVVWKQRQIVAERPGCCNAGDKPGSIGATGSVGDLCHRQAVTLYCRVVVVQR